MIKAALEFVRTVTDSFTFLKKVNCLLFFTGFSYKIEANH